MKLILADIRIQLRINRKRTTIIKYFNILVFCLLSNTALAELIGFNAFIDGRSQLIIQNDILYWSHISFAAPGKWSKNNHPTIVGDIEWIPSWPEEGRNDFCNCSSSSKKLFPPLNTLNNVSVHVLKARGPVKLIEAPTASNNYRMVLEFDDDDFGGADWYQVDITYTPR